MKQAASFQNYTVRGLLPGVKINTSPTDFAPISQLQLEKFKGETWERFGDIISSDVSD
jgi:branched-chain amino acid transport system substrate-binding protein